MWHICSVWFANVEMKLCEIDGWICWSSDSDRLKMFNSEEEAVEYSKLLHRNSIIKRIPEKYQYRNLPCVTKNGDKMQYAVSGVDTETKSVGVLEWCRSEQDAIEIIALMNAENGRFLGLSIERIKS